eukprot:2731858-Pleurochrysis_carterae.AAC.4
MSQIWPTLRACFDSALALLKRSDTCCCRSAASPCYTAGRVRTRASTTASGSLPTATAEIFRCGTGHDDFRDMNVW